MNANNRIAAYFASAPTGPVPDNAGTARQRRQKLISVRHDGFLPLVESDRLFFRVVAAAAPASLPATFRQGFHTAWGRIPPAARQLLLSYWSKPDPMLPDDYIVPNYKPLIQIVDRLPSDQICTKFGHELTFSATLMTQHPDCIAFEIARALAEVFRRANRRHWRLIQEGIEQPLGAWDASQPKKVTDAARDRKLDELEAEYLRVYHAEMTELLRNWGFAEPQLSTVS